METNDNKINYEIDCFNSAIIPFGGLDIKEAVKIAVAVGESGDWAAEEIKEFMDSCGISDMDKIDPVYVVLDRVFQNARNKIDEVMNIDIENDMSFYTYGNYCCSSIDRKDEDLEELQKAYNKLSLDDKHTLGDDEFFNYFADDVGLETIDNKTQE